MIFTFAFYFSLSNTTSFFWLEFSFFCPVLLSFCKVTGRTKEWVRFTFSIIAWTTPPSLQFKPRRKHSPFCQTKTSHFNEPSISTSLPFFDRLKFASTQRRECFEPIGLIRSQKQSNPCAHSSTSSSSSSRLRFSKWFSMQNCSKFCCKNALRSDHLL